MDAFAATCEAIAATGSRLQKVRHAADYLRTLDDDTIGIGACFLAGLPFARVDPRRLQVGWALMVRVSSAVTGWDVDVIRACARAAGDPSEAVALLLPRGPVQASFSVREARSIFERLSQTSAQARKAAILSEALGRMSPAAAKYFLKLLVGGLRIGLLEKQVEEAVALATGQSKDAVRDANMRAGDIEAVALAARKGTLEGVQANLFHPIDFMLATPVLSVAEIEHPEDYLVENKYDGIRAQAHVGGGRVALFSRGMGDVTRTFPEVVAALRELTGPLIMDGELLAVSGARALPFQLLQRRLSRKTPSAELQRQVSVAFVAYDLIHGEDGLLLDAPLEERQSRLHAIIETLQSDRLRKSPVIEAPTAESLDALFSAAREAGDEGLVLKRRGSTYEAGRRGKAWLKIKRALGTLDVVITAAEQGHGQRASMLSDYTFAVRSGTEVVNVGKAYTGLTDEEIRALTKRLQSLTLERFGGVRLVRPEIVLEVAFDTVQKSARHKSGFALRFPRIVRLRDDKQPEDVDTIDRVREIHDQATNMGRVEEVAAVDAEELPLFAWAKTGKRT